MIILLIINIRVEIINKWKINKLALVGFEPGSFCINKWKNKNKLALVIFEPRSFCTRVLKWQKNWFLGHLSIKENR